MKKTSKSRQSSRSLPTGGNYLLAVGRFNMFTAFVLIGFIVVTGSAIALFSHAADSTVAGSVTSASVKPTSDLINGGVLGYAGTNPPSQTNMYLDVDDGTSFGTSDNDATYVQDNPSFGGGSIVYSHTTGYSNVPAGRVTAAVANFSARTLSASGTARVLLFDGDTQIGAGPLHQLNAGYQNFSDSFTGLNVVIGNNLRTRVELTKDPNSTGVRYTELWLDLTLQPPTSSYVKPASQLDFGGVIGINNGSRTPGLSMFQDVADGTNFAAADGDATYVKTDGTGGSGQHKVEYQGIPKGTLVNVVANYRAKRTTGANGAVAQLTLWYGNTQVAVGQPHNLNTSYTNYTDHFSNLNIETTDTSKLRTMMWMYDPSGAGDARYTEVWLRADEVLR